jgi:soluble lytic murein transglycosylase-like protein
MTSAPIIRSAALQRALATTPAKPPTRTEAFAATLSTAAQSLDTRASVAAKWTKASQRPSPPMMRTAALSTVKVGQGDGAIPFKGLIEAAAKRHSVDPALLSGLVKAESGFNPNAQSGVGAKGLTQLMDATARGLGVSDAFDPAQALEGGAKFLSGLLKQFKGDERLALAAYNAGPGAVQKYGGIPPYEETQRYVPKVLGYAAQYRRIWADSSAPQTQTT